MPSHRIYLIRKANSCAAQFLRECGIQLRVERWHAQVYFILSSGILGDYPAGSPTRGVYVDYVLGVPNEGGYLAARIGHFFLEGVGADEVMVELDHIDLAEFDRVSVAQPDVSTRSAAESVRSPNCTTDLVHTSSTIT